jgi:hypothetical protein
MVLMKCPECEEDVSTEAKQCPHCGYKPGLGPSGRLFVTVLMVIGILLLFASPVVGILILILGILISRA